ncbi:hypothetical protein PR202_gb03268 [Eleusine coracana subsp. coracana]|uniref:Uncharacterized protein n=1 Tax=Eleusine coracana subsp. coracana TaxID=191504 RepID=A0AAV5DZR5_ELECO|nr:hypothetical protein PR202_gb03188 [Eleusine coracana subsp. coracana]GJN16295.1 hypothetical protein PR202_gb03268 [Eleusine coracana subsp. coracana]
MAPSVVRVDSPQTAVPTRAAEPGRTRLVAVAAPPLPAAALQRRARVVLYYRADGGGAEPPLWEEAVWAKESLSEALADHPEMAGRLRRRDDGSWEVKLNDAGARFTHATAEASLEEFLAAADGNEARWEAALAPWVDVKADDPDMCALFYLQVTRFQGDGGYAVGVSCSLMLCDPLSLARFLLSWAHTHAKMKAQNKLATNPLMQYAQYFQRPDAIAVRALVKTITLDAPASDAEDSHAAETALFRSSTGAKGSPDHRALASACIVQARERLGTGKAPSQFSMVVVGEGGMSIETCTAAAKPVNGDGGQYKLEAAQWKDLGLEELVLRDSKPVHVSCSIVTEGAEGLAVVMPDGAAGNFLVTATFTK